VAAELFAMEAFLVLALTEPEMTQDFLDFLWDVRQKPQLEALLKEDMSDVMVRIVGPEYVTPPYLSESYFADFVTKYMYQMVPMIHDAGAISRVHSHGKIKHALSEFVKTGVMCVDPVEPIPDGDISLRDAKALYGDKMILLGNIEMKFLELATPEEVDALVKGVMDEAKAGGGFILMPTATPITIPLSSRAEESLIAMIEAGHKYGQY